MISEKTITNLVLEKLADSDSFLVEVKVTPDNHITVLLDNVAGISITECVAVSRHVEGSLDRETEDYKLEVSSAGLDKPFKVLEQYTKNIGKQVVVLTNNSKNITGTLLTANETKIELEEHKKSKKKKIEEKIIHTIKQTDILKTTVVISF